MSGMFARNGVVGAVVSGNPYAANAAEQMLRDGGSAVDAAIAADATMGVVEPMSSGLGGDVLATILEPCGEVRSYNGTGRAPRNLDLDAINEFDQHRIPQRHVLSITTPGIVRGWSELHERYGRLPWDRLFTPAIEQATHGFQVARIAAREWKFFEYVLLQDEECGALYHAGKVPIAGEVFTNPKLANALTLIADEGDGVFYGGIIGAAAARATQRHGGVLTIGDLQAHTGEFTTPLSTDVFGCRVYECPPNTHGVAVLDALRRIARNRGDKDEPGTWVGIVDATRDALDQAKRTVADPSGNTVCNIVVDGDGLAITLMSSIFKRFGSGVVVPEYGFCLQNRGFGFAAPGEINGASPERRPYHTVIPALITKEGELHMAIGVVGGLMQPQGQIQILTRILGWGDEPQAAVQAPRWRLETETELAIEPEFNNNAVAALRSTGYAKPRAHLGEFGGRSDFGGAHTLFRSSRGEVVCFGDHRRDSVGRVISS